MKWIQMISPRAIILASLLMVAGQASAQMGGVRGIVQNENGDPLEGVEITIELEGGGRTFTAKTNKNGQYTKAGIRVGSYKMSFFLDGYEQVSSQIQVSFGKPSELDAITLAKLPEGVLTMKAHAAAQGQLDAAMAASKAGDHDATIEALNKFLELVPDSAEAYYNLGVTYEAKGDSENALLNYEKTVEVDAAMRDAWLAMGDLYGRQKNWKKGMESLQKALEIQADTSVVLFNYGAYAFNAGDVEAAGEAFEKLIAADPNHALGHYRLAMVYVGQGKTDEAILHIEKFLELEPEGPNAPAAKNLLATLKQG